MIERHLIPILSLITVLCLSACHSQQTPQQDSQKLVVTDFSGQQLSFDKPVERIVALAPHIVENLYAIGAGKQIVGVVEHSDFPVEAKQLPIVGGYESSNHERIVELNPDLIIAWESGNSHGSITKLKSLGFKVLIDQPDSLDDITKSLRMLAAVTGHDETGNLVAQQFQSQLDRLRAQNATKRKVRTFYQVWNEPLFTINDHHIISDAIRVCGGENIFADELAVAPRINIESLIKRDPEVIIASGMSEKQPEWLDDWRQWPGLMSVQRNNLFYVDPDHLQRHTMRQLLAIDAICAQLDEARSK